MIEFIGLIGLVIAILLGYTKYFDFAILINSTYAAFLIYIIFAKCFYTINSIQAFSKKQRLKQEILLAVVATICLAVLYLYFTNYFKCKFIILLIINFVCLLIYSGTKYYLLKHNSYGKIYIFWQLIDIILIIISACLNSYLSVDTLTNKLLLIIFINTLLLALVNEHIDHSLNYWMYLKLFKNSVKFLLITGKEVQLINPPEKNLEKDPVYSKCVYILKDSFIRIYSLYKLARITKKILLENGKSFKEAQLLSSRFLGILVNNLMRRKYDHLFLPYFLIEKYYNIERKIERKLKELKRV